MNNFLAFQVHGNADNQGLSGVLDAVLTFLDGLLGKSASEIFIAFMPGIASLDNLHPLLVHFPIAFLSGFVLLDLLASLAKKPQWREFASALLYLGTGTALFTVIAGFIAARSVAHGENVHSIMETHEVFGIVILVLATALSVWRLKSGSQIQGEMNILHLILSGVLGLCLALGADLGGLLVYQYGVAVKAVPESVTDAYIHHTHSH